MEDFTQEDLLDFQRAFQMQTRIENSPSLRDGDTEKLLKKVNINFDSGKTSKSSRAMANLSAPSAGKDEAGFGGMKMDERVDFLELLENMSKSFVDDKSTDKELEDAFRVSFLNLI